MVLQNLKHATPIRRYRIGNFIGTLLTNCEGSEYAHALVIYQLIGYSQTAKPVLVIAAEHTDHNLTDEFSLVSSLFDGDSTYHGSSKTWADIESFEAEALKLAIQRFDITEDPAIMNQHQES